MRLIKIASAAALTSLASAQAAFLGGWDFQTTTVGTDLTAGIGFEKYLGSNGATLTSASGNFITTSGLGTGNSTITSSSDSFWDDNTYAGGTSANDEGGTKAIIANGDSLSFTIEFDASGASDLALYMMWSDQKGLSYGSVSGSVLAEPLVITLFADGTTSTLTSDTLNTHEDATYQDQTSGGLGGSNDGSIDISALDGASVARITFTTSLYTGGGNTGAGNLIVDNIGITGAVGSTVSVVPEPSTYAAIFGVIALAVAAYRRRK